MATKKQVEFQKVWEDAKREATRLSKDINIWVKKGEKELVKFSGQAKINFEIVSSRVKKEKLFHEIGKDYYSTAASGKTTSTRLDKLVGQIQTIDKQIVANKRLLKKSVQ